MNPDTKFIVNNNINDLIQSQVGRLTQAFYSGSPFPIMAIFFTKENLQLSLPLLAITGTYAYFRFLPLVVALPLLGVLAVVYKAYQSYLSTKRVAILRSLEKDATIAAKSAIDELMEDEEKKDREAEEKKKKKQNKKKQKEIQDRKKKNAPAPVSQSLSVDDDSDDDADFDYSSIVRSNKAKKDR